MYSLNAKGKLYCWASPVVMGIINVTPDSFYSGSRMQNKEDLIRQADKMLTEGAAILDLGGLSTRPGADDLPAEQEIQRVVPAIETLVEHFPQALISVDSHRKSVAEAALRAGASIINDVGASAQEGMMELAAEYRAPYICMHMRGNPRTMQSLNGYQDITGEILDYFVERHSQGLKMGVRDFIIDPGFGFTKSIRQNFLLLNEMKLFRSLGLPVLAGLSRKSTVYKTLGITPAESLNGTTVLHTLALEQGVSILRVHDVKEAVEVIRLWTSYADAQDVPDIG